MPLEHIRATVLTQAWAGAYATRLLADMGAEVIQIESLDRIDPWRGGYPPRLSGTYPDRVPGDRPYDRNAAYNSVNTGKKGITLDLNDAQAKDALLELVSISDVFAENFSGRVLPNLGLEYPTLRTVNPSVVLLRMPAFGCTGPYATYMGNGGTIEPMSGITSLLGYEGGPPMNSGVMHTDAFAGMLATSAIMIALHHRARTGQGQEIDLSQQESSIGLIPEQVIGASMSGRVPARRGNRSDRMAPHNNYRCKGTDAWIAIAVRTDAEWRRLCAVMDMPKLGSAARFQDMQSRLANTDELDGFVSEWTRHHEAYEITRLLQDAGIPSAPVMKATELAGNPQLRERGFIQELDHPETGARQYAGAAWLLSRTPGKLGGPSPKLGQHSIEVLTGHLGMEPKVVDEMTIRGITGDQPSVDA